MAISLFSVPKPFRGHIGIIQTNAIQSWTMLRPACEIILFGDEEGTAEMAVRFRVRHVPGVKLNEYGTPLLNSLFDKAQQIASHRLLCYVNADIILMSDFIRAIQRIRKRSFLMVGQRWLLDLNGPVNFDGHKWESWLCNTVAERGILDRPDGLDYFVFPRGLFKGIPPFAIGRTTWDNWLIYKARSLSMPVIDATSLVTAVHQNHDYFHHPQGMQGIWEGAEAKGNLELAGGHTHVFTLWDATWILKPQGLRLALTYTHLRRRRDMLPILFPKNAFRARALRFLLSLGISLHIWLPRLHPLRLAEAVARRVLRLGRRL